MQSIRKETTFSKVSASLADRELGEADLLSEISEIVKLKAFNIVSHLLMPSGSKVAIIGSKNVTLSYAIASLNPRMKFTAIDLDPKAVKRGNDRFKRPNLKFKKKDIAHIDEDGEKYDAIINVDILHEAYSAGNYNARIVESVLEAQFGALKTGGSMLIYDHVEPPQGEAFVLMEFPEGKDGDIERLIWFSEHARPLHPKGCRGFFLEEIAPRFPKTRLFRMPHKWACEYVLRKDTSSLWKASLSQELTFFDERAYRETIWKCGGRVQYSAPQWNNRRIKSCFQGQFRLLDENGQALGFPSTSYMLVAQKIEKGGELRIREHRPVNSETLSDINITAMRNDKTGEVQEVVSMNQHFTEVLAYAVDSANRVTVFVEENVDKGIINTRKPGIKNIDGRSWSGHMVCVPKVPSAVFNEAHAEDSPRKTIELMREYTGLETVLGEKFEEGPRFYPAPDYIEDRIETYFTQVKPDVQGRKGIKGYDAQDLLRAIHCGYVPNIRLEMQINALLEKLGLFVGGILSDEAPAIPAKQAVEEILLTEEELEEKKFEKKTKFTKARGKYDQLRAKNSVFAREAFDDGHASRIGSDEMSYVINNDCINKAVILPLTRDLSGDVLAGFQFQDVPVPNRYGGDSTMLSLPGFNLPPEIKNIDQAKRYIAEKLDTSPEMVSQLGPSYFEHMDVTPQRIFPFAAAMKPGGKSWTKGRYAPVSKLYRINKLDCTDSFLWVIGLTQKMCGPDSDLYAAYSNMDMHNIRDEKVTPMSTISSDSGYSKKEPA